MSRPPAHDYLPILLKGAIEGKAAQDIADDSGLPRKRISHWAKRFGLRLPYGKTCGTPKSRHRGGNGRPRGTKNNAGATKPFRERRWRQRFASSVALGGETINAFCHRFGCGSKSVQIAAKEFDHTFLPNPYYRSIARKIACKKGWETRRLRAIQP